MKEPIYQFTNLPISQIRQVVPPERCFSCDVCCRFPEKDSFLAPYFAPEEIVAATTILPLPLPLRGGGEGEGGGKGGGGKITLTPYKEGYICPAFDPATAHCKIYNARPIDCRLYPFAVMWDAAGREILLGLDSKCPYVRERREDPVLGEAAAEIASAIESEPLLNIFALNRGLIGLYQEDVIPLMTLRRLSGRVISNETP